MFTYIAAEASAFVIAPADNLDASAYLLGHKQNLRLYSKRLLERDSEMFIKTI